MNFFEFDKGLYINLDKITVIKLNIGLKENYTDGMQRYCLKVTTVDGEHHFVDIKEGKRVAELFDFLQLGKSPAIQT